MKFFAAPAAIAAGLMGILIAPLIQADPLYKRTEVTFSAPVEIPGMVLPAGTYVMKLLDPYMERNVVRFYNKQENHMYAMAFAIPDYRLVPTDHTVITFEERAHNSPQAIKEWFPAGDNWGEEFVYPKAHPVVAEAPAPSIPIASAPKAPLAPAPAAQVQPSTPRVETAQVEIAQAQPAPAPTPAAAPAPEQPKELPKTASDLPLAASCGAALVIAGAFLRRRTA